MARPSSAKGRVESPVHSHAHHASMQPSGSSPAPPPVVSEGREARIHSPTHTKAATVGGGASSFTDGPGPRSPLTLASVPPETEARGGSGWTRTASISSSQSYSRDTAAAASKLLGEGGKTPSSFAVASPTGHKPSSSMAATPTVHKLTSSVTVTPFSYRPSSTVATTPVSHKSSSSIAATPVSHKPGSSVAVTPISHSSVATTPVSYKSASSVAATSVSHKPSSSVAVTPSAHKPAAATPTAHRLSSSIAVTPTSHKPPDTTDYGHARVVMDSDLPFISSDLRLKESISGKVKEPSESRLRKSSEPPPSLMALFDNSMASSRRSAMMKQTSADQVTACHPRQTSLDSSQLHTVQGSPKHGRKMKASSKSNMQRAPSHPHLNSTTSSPQVARVSLTPLNPPIHRARSTQQLKQETDEVAAALKRRSFSGGKDDMHSLTSTGSRPHSPGPSLSSSADAAALRVPSREEFREKEQSSMRRTPSHESLPDRDKGERSARDKENWGWGVVGKELKDSLSGSSLPPLAVSKEAHERTLPAPKDTQMVVKEHFSTADMVYSYPVMTGRGSSGKSRVDVRRRNSMGIRDTLGIVPGGKRPRPHSMIETSSFRPASSGYSLDVNTAAPDLLAQLFWTAASLLESDFEGEFSMALRLLSKVRTVACGAAVNPWYSQAAVNPFVLSGYT